MCKQPNRMKRILKTILILLILTVAGCNIFDKGQNSIISEHLSPDKRIKVIVFEKSGNASTNSSIHASVIENNFKLRNTDKGNIFIADEFEKTNYSRDSFLLVNWINNSIVEINYPSLVRLFKIEEKFKIDKKEIMIKHNSRKDY